jgi:hypothetical protein
MGQVGFGVGIGSGVLSLSSSFSCSFDSFPASFGSRIPRFLCIESSDFGAMDELSEVARGVYMVSFFILVRSIVRNTCCLLLTFHQFYYSTFGDNDTDTSD